MNNLSNSPQAYSLASPWSWSIPIVALLGAAIIWALESNQSLFLWLNAFGRSTVAGTSWANMTLLGDVLVAFSLLGLFARRRPDIVWAMLIAAVFATLWSQGIKHLVDSPRPLAVIPSELIQVIGVALHKYSFPSGHTTTAFTFAGIICLQRVSPLWAISVIIMACLVGVSRAVVGAHWPIDIFAGALGGWLSAVIGSAISRKWSAPSSIMSKSIIASILLACSLSLLFLHDSQYPADTLQMIIGLASTISLVMYMLSLYRDHHKSPL